MDRSRISKFCHCCGSSVEQNFKFCSQCGQAVVITNDNEGPLSATSRSTGNETMSTSSTRTSSTTASRDTNKSSTSLSLKSFNAFKEKERSSFFVQKKVSKRAKLDPNEVKITIAVMEDITKIKQGDSLKIPASSSAKEILDVAVMKHATFNKRFNCKLEYTLVFKDGTEVITVPGTAPPEPFTLSRYRL